MLLRRIYWLLALFLLTPLACAHNAQAAGSYNVGFRTLGQRVAESDMPLNINVWYPSTSHPRELNYAPWEIMAARGGNLVQGRFPLLLLSHDSTGTRFSYHDTAAFLASCGFVVAAPNHSGDSMDNMDTLFTRRQLEDRAKILSATVTLLLNHAELAPGIDKNRIGALGFGSGATAALLLGGALPDCGGWGNYCADTNSKDIYCNPWAKNRLDSLCKSLPFTKSLADNRVGAVAAIAPGFGMLFSHDSFRYFYPPLLLMAAEKDSVNSPVLHAESLYRLMDKKPRYLVLEDADTGAMMAPCPDTMSVELPELCRSVTFKQRRVIHQQMHEALGDFFLHYLGSTDSPPVIPSPPNLTPPPQEVTPAPSPPTPAQRSRQPRRNTR